MSKYEEKSTIINKETLKDQGMWNNQSRHINMANHLKTQHAQHQPFIRQLPGLHAYYSIDFFTTQFLIVTGTFLTKG